MDSNFVEGTCWNAMEWNVFRRKAEVKQYHCRLDQTNSVWSSFRRWLMVWISVSCHRGMMLGSARWSQEEKCWLIMQLRFLYFLIWSCRGGDKLREIPSNAEMHVSCEHYKKDARSCFSRICAMTSGATGAKRTAMCYVLREKCWPKRFYCLSLDFGLSFITTLIGAVLNVRQDDRRQDLQGVKTARIIWRRFLSAIQTLLDVQPGTKLHIIVLKTIWSFYTSFIILWNSTGPHLRWKIKVNITRRMFQQI